MARRSARDYPVGVSRWVVLGILVAVACGSEESTSSKLEGTGGDAGLEAEASASGGVAGQGGQPVVCTPGQESTCYGDGLCLGSHVCNSEGTAFGVCACADANSSGGAGGTGLEALGVLGSDVERHAATAPLAAGFEAPFVGMGDAAGWVVVGATFSFGAVTP